MFVAQRLAARSVRFDLGLRAAHPCDQLQARGEGYGQAIDIDFAAVLREYLKPQKCCRGQLSDEFEWDDLLPVRMRDCEADSPRSGSQK